MYLLIGAANVLYEGGKDGPPVVLPEGEVPQELPHQGDVGDVHEEDSQVGRSKRHGFFRALREEQGKL